jgi:hypothetical protein
MVGVLPCAPRCVVRQSGGPVPCMQGIARMTIHPLNMKSKTVLTVSGGTNSSVTATWPKFGTTVSAEQMLVNAFVC